MRAVLLVARSEARRRRMGLLGLALIVALVAAAGFGSMAGARRTATALERYRDETSTRDGRAFAFVLGAEVAEGLVAEVQALDGVDDVGGSVIYGTDASFEVDTSILAPIDGTQYQTVDVPLLLDGRLPDPDEADEVVLSEDAVEELDLHTGDRLQVNTFSDEDCAALASDDFLGFNGPALDLEIVGEVRVIEELQGSAIEAGPVAVATPAFSAAHAEDACGVGVLASARFDEGGGPSDQELMAATRRAAPETGEIGAGSIEAEFLDSVQSAVDVVVKALLVFALVTGVAGLVALVQGVIRQVGAAREVDETLGAMGLTRSQRAAAAALPTALAAVPGVVVGMIAAVAVSGVFPLGVARQAEPDPGVLVDPVVLGVGALSLVLLVAVTAFLAARRPAGVRVARGRRSRIASAGAQAGWAPSVIIGLDLVEDRNRSRSAVRTALVGTSLAVAGVCAVLVMATSLVDVVDEPERYGWVWTAKPDLDSDDPEATIQDLTAEDDLAAVGVLDQARLDVDGEGLEGFALDVLKGTMELPVLDGRVPSSLTEIALGAGALDDVDLGDTVTLTTAEGSDIELDVVGRVVLPPFDSAGASTALVTPEVIADLGVDEEKNLVITYADGVDAAQLETRLEEEHGLSFPLYSRANPPGRLVHLDDIRGLFTALAGFFALLGLIGLAHALATTTRRQRTAFATLRSLGLLRRQVMTSVLVASLVIVGIGIAVGVPVGVATGRQVWLASVGDLGIQVTPTVPLAAVAGVVAMTLAAAVLIAGTPAWRAGHRPPIDGLRAE